MIDEELNLNVNTVYSIDKNKNIELLDTTDEDVNNITTKLHENKALLSLIEDLSLDDTTNSLTFSSLE